MRLLMSLHFQTMWHYIAICGSILVYYAFIFVYCRIPMTAIGHISSTIYDVVYEVSATGLRSSSASALHAMLRVVTSVASAHHHQEQSHMPAMTACSLTWQGTPKHIRVFLSVRNRICSMACTCVHAMGPIADMTN